MRYCNKCGIGLMDHPKAYTYTCTKCGYSFLIDPSGKTPKITILSVGDQKLQKEYQRSVKK